MQRTTAPSISYLSSEFGAGMVEAFVNVRAPYEIRAHHHPHFELLYITKGCRRLWLDERRYNARAGDLIVFRPGEVHREAAGSKTLSYVVLRFKPERLSAVGVEFPGGQTLGPVFQLAWRKIFLELFGRMLKEREQPRENSHLLLNAYLVEFIVLLRRALVDVLVEERETSGDNSRLETAIGLIQQNLKSPPRLSDLARRSFMSASHFSHVFKAQIGMSPKSFIVSERIDKAKELLAKTQLPAQDIAAVLGYESPFFFYRQFKQKTGLTALAYRARCSQKASFVHRRGAETPRKNI